MPNEKFFKSTYSYHEYLMLDQFEKNPKVTQRELAKILNISVSMINLKIVKFENESKIKRIHHNSKNVEYLLTSKGLKRKKQLNMMYLHSAQVIYDEARQNIVEFIQKKISKGFKTLLLYGAGEVTSILLSVISRDFYDDIIISTIIEDDPLKIGTKVRNIPVISLNNINDFDYDGILISSHNHHEQMLKKLESINVDVKKILKFF